MSELVTVTGRFVGPDDSPVDGWLEWSLVPNHIPDTANDVDVNRGPVRATLVDGEFTIQVRATDDPDLVDHVDGPIVYKVRHSAGSEWQLLVPAPGHHDWADLAPPAESAGAVIPVPGPPGADGAPGAAGPQGVQGEQGEPGVTGATGATGPQGIQGNPGASTTIVGEVATVGALPPVGTVEVGDSYIVTADGNLYTSTGTVWLDVGQIVGPQGPTGATGATGATGGQGIQGVQGVQGVPGDTGATGASGATGEKGDPGEPGGSLLTAFWTYASTTTAPPSAGQARTNSPITTLWLSETDTDGMNRAAGLTTAESGDTIIVRAANGTAMDLLITGTPVDSGTYYTIPVSVTTGTVTKGARTQFGILSPTPHGIPAGGSDGQVLTKTSGSDYAADWETATTAAHAASHADGGSDPVTIETSQVGGLETELGVLLGLIDTKAPIRRTLNAQTGTTYTPVVGDENLMITLSNAAAITVTLPQNSAAAFPVGAEVDFLWLGVGQPTFTNGTGATVNGTPGLKLRARYSAATAKKVATDAWVIIGDVSAV